MIEFIIVITIIGLWGGGVYLYLFLESLRDDLIDINNDVESLITRLDKIEKLLLKNNKGIELKGEEFLGI